MDVTGDNRYSSSTSSSGSHSLREKPNEWDAGSGTRKGSASLLDRGPGQLRENQHSGTAMKSTKCIVIILLCLVVFASLSFAATPLNNPPALAVDAKDSR